MSPASDITAERSNAPAAARSLPAHVEVAIVGAGFGGLCAAIRLKEQGHEDFVVLERAADVGGTWQLNTYPGCQCDVPSNLYSFSFAPKPDWTHSYPEQPQIQRYLRDCAERFGVIERTHLSCEVHGAAWDPGARRWQVETSQGVLSAKALVAAAGLLSEPATPQVPGLDAFDGTVFHTARWNHEHDLTGERVALIGTGATAIQVGPAIHPKVARLDVYQRTPPWIIPHPDRGIPPALQTLYRRVPAVQLLARQAVYALREGIAAGMAHDPRLLRLQDLTARMQLRLQVRDPAFRAKLTPDYTIGCKRILLSNDWYPMLTDGRTALVTDPIAEVRGRSIVTADGTERGIDSIILATGFKPTDPEIAHRLRRADGRTLAEVWKGSPEAFVGTTMKRFPNLFLLYGPNTNLGHSSIVYMLEAQVHYLLQALALVRDPAVASIDVRPEVQQAYNEDLGRRLAPTVWSTGGCSSWYLDANGRNATMWPDFTFRFRQLVDRFQPEHYEIEPAAPQTVATAAGALA